MSKDANLVQTKCEACHLAVDREESYAMLANEDWTSPFMQYLIKGVLPQKQPTTSYMREFFSKKDTMGTITMFGSRKG